MNEDDLYEIDLKWSLSRTEEARKQIDTVRLALPDSANRERLANAIGTLDTLIERIELQLTPDANGDGLEMRDIRMPQPKKESFMKKILQ